jgi:dTDP-glucose 4,6-dehydratase
MNDTANGWNGVRVLVTGAAGFIGSHVVESLLAQRASVRAFVRYTSRHDLGRLAELPSLGDVDVYRGDLMNPEAVTGALTGCDVVLHLGALIPIPYSYLHPREYLHANVEATVNVLEASRRAGIRRLVHVSTSEVYGSAQHLPIDEDHPLRPQSPYAASKVAADQFALSYARSFELPVVIARPFNTFGPRQSPRAVIPTILLQALSGDTIELGTTTTTRDFLFVEDTAAGILAAAATPGVEGETFNLGTGIERSVADVVTAAGAALGRELTVVQRDERMRPEQSEVDRLLADAGKAKRLLGFEPAVDFETGLRRTAEWLERELPSLTPSRYYV